MIDSHCHLDDKKFKDDLPEVIERSVQTGVKHIICPSTDTDSFKHLAEIQSRYPDYISTAIGVHPSEANDTTVDDMDEFSDLIRRFKPIAIGEIGLDYYWSQDNKYEQQKLFNIQLRLAEIYGFPAIIHSRSAVMDCLKILKGYPVKAVFHCYSEDLDSAQNIIDSGHFISFTGNITYPKSDALRQVVKVLPLSKIFLETDSPYLSPQKKRGRRNEPAYVKYLYEFVSELKSVSIGELKEQFEKNIRNLFNI